MSRFNALNPNGCIDFFLPAEGEILQRDPSDGSSVANLLLPLFPHAQDSTSTSRP